MVWEKAATWSRHFLFQKPLRSENLLYFHVWYVAESGISEKGEGTGIPGAFTSNKYYNCRNFTHYLNKTKDPFIGRYLSRDINSIEII